MTIYHKVGREIEVVGAVMTDKAQTKVWWSYVEEEFTGDNSLDDSFRGVECSPITELVADGGTDEIIRQIQSIPDNRVRGSSTISQQPTN